MKLKLFVLVLVLQSAWLLGVTCVQEHALATGKVILLETRRADPRDLLRGDYLILDYKINNVPTNMFSPPVTKDLQFGTKIYVALAVGTNEFWEVTRASTNEFTASVREIVLRGQSSYVWWNVSNSVSVAYGIEKYYISEGTGNPSGKLTVQAVVPASGHPKIKAVFLGGKPYADVMKGTEN